MALVCGRSPDRQKPSCIFNHFMIKLLEQRWHVDGIQFKVAGFAMICSPQLLIRDTIDHQQGNVNEHGRASQVLNLQYSAALNSAVQQYKCKRFLTYKDNLLLCILIL